jgi:DNA-binding transcriptional LysR family regulator
VHLTQPALSKTLNEIEAAFGFELFTRTPRGLLPTERGRAALRGARQLLLDLGHLQQEVSRGAVATILRVGAPPFVAHGYLPAVIAQLTARVPPVHVQLMEERVPMLLRALGAGEVDALVSSYPAQMPDDLGVVLRIERLFDARFTVIAPVKHALVRAARVDWPMLARHPWVMPARTSMVRRVIEEGFLRAGVVAPTPVVESTSPVTNVQLVAAGVGWSVVPEPTARQAVAARLVAAVAVRPALASGPVALLYRENVSAERIAPLRELLLRARP